MCYVIVNVKKSSVILMNLFVMDFVSLNNCTLCRPCCEHISDPCNWMAQVKSGERCQNRVAGFGLNGAYMKIRTPNSPCSDFWGQGKLTPLDTWSSPTLGLASVLMLRPISPEVVLFPDF